MDRYAEREPNVAAHLLGGLAGPGVDERRRRLAARVPEAVLAGLAGQDDDVSWELRQWLWEQKPMATALTLLGLPAANRRAAAMRAALADMAPTEVADVARGRRRRGGEQPARPALPAQPRGGGGVARAAGVAGGLVAARAVAGVAPRGARVALRDRARRGAVGHGAARRPRLAAAGAGARRRARRRRWRRSTGVLGDAAWRWREELPGARAEDRHADAGRRATTTARGRCATAVAADCKEALDSIVALDGPRAWSLRETHADVWPSTVVKSLGPLADGGRGRTLIARQLAAHPNSLSLLKHASAVALGVHRLKVGAERLKRRRGGRMVQVTARDRFDGQASPWPRSPSRSRSRASAAATAIPGAMVTPDCMAAEGEMLPWKTGNTWTYVVNDEGVVSMKETTIGAMEPVGGTGPQQGRAGVQGGDREGRDGSDDQLAGADGRRRGSLPRAVVLGLHRRARARGALGSRTSCTSTAPRRTGSAAPPG